MNVICWNDKYFYICYNILILFFFNRICIGVNFKKNLYFLRNFFVIKKKNLFIYKVDKNIILNRYYGYYKFKCLI